MGFRIIRIPCIYLYPMTILKGDHSPDGIYGNHLCRKGQNLDTGAKVVHIGKNTSSFIGTRSISKDGGISTFRSSVQVEKSAKNTKARCFLSVPDAG